MDKQQLKAGTNVAFRIADVICPDFQQIVQQIGPELDVNGEVAFVSDNGEKHGLFAVVEVRGIHAPLIVPAECVKAGIQRSGEPITKADMEFRLSDSVIRELDLGS